MVTLNQVNQEAALSAMALVAGGVAGVLFLGTIIIGGLLSTGKPMPAASLKIHQITPFLTLLSTVGTLYLVMSRT